MSRNAVTTMTVRFVVTLYFPARAVNINSIQQFLVSARFEVLMQVVRKTVISCTVVRWVGASLSEETGIGWQVRAFWKDLLSVDRCEPFGRTCCRWTVTILLEGPIVGGHVRAFGKDLLSVDRCEPLGRTCFLQQRSGRLLYLLCHLSWHLYNTPPGASSAWTRPIMVMVNGCDVGHILGESCHRCWPETFVTSFRLVMKCWHVAFFFCFCTQNGVIATLFGVRYTHTHTCT